ncbi:DUF309 domain-containing protein [Synechocystis sp. PCC 7509]|uniref:DUF309 domain-containing protein n=1 Tax=Synechocystis sp. PCC 7509 TaxID=927677 RepID=UPI0002ABC3DA|nr:DUF309 domain-containing protein [Synechocystis sp. PCC 7509]
MNSNEQSIVPTEFWHGVEQFNQEQFYACHDTLEALWMEATEPQKTFYQGILQIAVALYHLGNSNVRGACILLGEGTNKLSRYPESYAGIDVDELLDASTALLTQLQQNVKSLLLLPKINLIADAEP